MGAVERLARGARPLRQQGPVLANSHLSNVPRCCGMLGHLLHRVGYGEDCTQICSTRSRSQTIPRVHYIARSRYVSFLACMAPAADCLRIQSTVQYRRGGFVNEAVLHVYCKDA